MTAAAAIATVGGIGRIRLAPGSVASLVTVFAAAGLATVGGFVLILSAGLAATAAGVWAAEIYCRERGAVDPSECVIDEVAGQFLACACAPRTLLGYVFAFLLFRALDILKPWPISAAERLPGGTGIMADDLLAGVLAGLMIVTLVQVHFIAP